MNIRETNCGALILAAPLNTDIPVCLFPFVAQEVVEVFICYDFEFAYMKYLFSTELICYLLIFYIMCLCRYCIFMLPEEIGFNPFCPRLIKETEPKTQ